MIVAAEDLAEKVAAIRAKPGKDIWLFGGGSLFRSLATAEPVDMVEVTVIPVLLGAGIPLPPPPADRIQLTLTSQRIYEAGTVSLVYTIAWPGGCNSHYDERESFRPSELARLASRLPRYKPL